MAKGVTLGGLKMPTPHLDTLMADEFVQWQMAKDLEKTYDNDWEAADASVCPKCDGAKINPRHPEDGFCLNCDGTGIEFIVYYGVKNKQSYSYTVEYGIEFKKEYCKAMREAFEDQQRAGKVGELSMIQPYALPKTIEMEMKARGFDLDEYRKNNELEEVAEYVAEHFPEYMCVPYKKFVKTKKKAFIH